MTRTAEELVFGLIVFVIVFSLVGGLASIIFGIKSGFLLGLGAAIVMGGGGFAFFYKHSR